VHAPTEDKDDKVKSSLCDTLDRFYQTINEHDAIIVMEYMNARVGEEFLTPCDGKYRLYKISNYNIKYYVILRPAENSSLSVIYSHFKIFIFKPGYLQIEKHPIK
jgi:hypothetical protein